MSKEQNISILIEQYLAGELKGEELAQFETQLENDSILAQEVDLERVIQGAVIDDGLLDWKVALEQESLALKKKRAFKKKIALAATAILLLSGTWFMLREQKVVKSEETLPLENEVVFTDVIQEKEVKKNNVVQELLEKEAKKSTVSVEIPVDEEKLDSPLSENKLVEKQQEVIVLEPVITPVEVEMIEPKKDLCENVVMKAQLSIVATCEGENEGLVIVKSIDGGTPPYQYKLGGMNPWQSRNSFDHLEPSSYSLIIKDKNGCQSLVDEDLIVEEKYCYKPEAGFNPNFETWEFHLEDNKAFTITLVNKRGQEIYQERVDGIFEWNGRDANGNEVASGLYKYIVVSNGEKKLGTVTVIY